MAFADTFQNRIMLADGYVDMHAFAKAETQYTAALKGSHANDFYGHCQLLTTFFAQEKYDEAIEIGKKLEGHTDFQGSPTQFTYGLSLAKVKDYDAAEKILTKIDKRYSNYNERLILAQYFLDRKKTKEAKEILSDLQAEAINMTKPNRKLYGETFATAETLFTQLNAAT